MHCELPAFKRCCFCLPLRGSLIGWGYFRLAVDVFSIILRIFFTPNIYLMDYDEITTIVAAAVCFFIDAVFGMFLVVGGHKKNSKFLRISYIYCIVWLALVLPILTYLIYNDIYWLQRRASFDFNIFHTLEFIATDLGVFVFITFAQVYVILLTRSEEIKLRKENLEVQFVNNTADAESISVRTSIRATN